MIELIEEYGTVLIVCLILPLIILCFWEMVKLAASGTLGA